MSPAEDFINFVNNFLKRPIFPSQEAQIVCLMLDGTINMNSAKELYKYIMEQNTQRTHELMSKSREEIMDLVD